MNQDDKNDKTSKGKIFLYLFLVSIFPISFPFFDMFFSDKPKKKKKPMPVMTWKHLQIFLLILFVLFFLMIGCANLLFS